MIKALSEFLRKIGREEKRKNEEKEKNKQIIYKKIEYKSYWYGTYV